MLWNCRECAEQKENSAKLMDKLDTYMILNKNQYEIIANLNQENAKLTASNIELSKRSDELSKHNVQMASKENNFNRLNNKLAALVQVDTNILNTIDLISDRLNALQADTETDLAMLKEENDERWEKCCSTGSWVGGKINWNEKCLISADKRIDELYKEMSRLRALINVEACIDKPHVTPMLTIPESKKRGRPAKDNL